VELLIAIPVFYGLLDRLTLYEVVFPTRGLVKTLKPLRFDQMHPVLHISTFNHPFTVVLPFPLQQDYQLCRLYNEYLGLPTHQE
jgi:hypothetical protein